MKKTIGLILTLLLVVCIFAVAMAEENVYQFPEMGLQITLTEKHAAAGLSVISENDVLAVLFQDQDGTAAILAVIQTVPGETYNAQDLQIVEQNNMRGLGTNEEYGYYLVSVNTFPDAEAYLNTMMGEGYVASIKPNMEKNKQQWDEAIAEVPTIIETVAFIPVVKAEKIVPAFTTVDIYGNTVTNDIFAQADITVVNIWGTFCGPCINEMPELGQWSREMPENVQIIGLVSDIYSADDSSTITNAQAIAEATQVDFVNLIPSEGLMELLTISPYVPTTIFVDSTGKIVGEPVIGANVPQYKQFVEDYLSGLEK